MYKLRREGDEKWFVIKTDQDRPKGYKQHKKAQKEEKIGEIDKEAVAMPEDILPFVFDDLNVNNDKLREVLTVIAMSEWGFDRDTK